MNHLEKYFSQRDLILTSFLLGVMVLLAPLFPQLSHPKFEFFFRSCLYLMMAILFVRVGVSSAMARWKTLPWLFPALLGLLWFMFTITYSPAMYRATEKLSLMIAALLLLLILYTFPFSNKTFTLLAWCLATGGLLAALQGLYRQWIGFDEFINQMKMYSLYDEEMRREMIVSLEANRAMGRFSNPNHLAGYLVLTLWVLWYLWKQQQSRILITLYCIPIFIGIYQTFSRSGFLAFVLTLFLITGYEMGQRGWFQKIRDHLKPFLVMVSLAFLLVGGTFLALILFRPAWIPETLLGGRLLTISTIVARIHFFRGALSIIEQYPIIGVGPEGFESYYSQILRPGDAESRYVHNWFLESAVEGGILATFLLFWFLGSIILYLYRKKGKLSSSALFTAFGTGSIFLLFSLIDFTNNLMEYWIIPLFFLARIDRQSFTQRTSPTWIKGIGYALCIFLACAWLLLGLCRYLNETYREQGQILTMDDQPRAAIQAYEKAVLFDRSDAESWRDLSRVWAQLPSPQAKFQWLRCARMAVKWAPRRASMHADLADALFVLGYTERALEEIRTAQQLFPARPIYYKQHAHMLEQLGLEEEAQKKIQEAQTLEKLIEQRKL